VPDSRFFQRAGPFSLQDIAQAIGAEALDTAGIASIPIHDIAPLESATASEITVFSDVRYIDALSRTRAHAVVTSRDLARHTTGSYQLVVVKNPRLAYAVLGQLFYPPTALEPGISASALIHPTARIGAGSQVDAGAVIGSGVEIGTGCHISYNAVLGDGVRLGDRSMIGANSSVSHALIGEGVEIATGVTIGSEGFGFVPGPTGLMRMLQLGRVIIEDRVKIGANCSIDRGATEDTVIGAGSVLDNQVHIAHNVRLGRHCVICAQVGIAGSTIVGDGVVMGGQVGVADHLTVGANARIAAKSGVTRNVEPSTVVGGFPAIPIKSWHRQTAGLARLFRRTPVLAAKG
jgi:UDP-3-O-[3-hydroxymyristoyl] glucosamine N-acyltransferase